MILGKTLKNYIERMILQKIGINSNDGKIRKMQNEINSLRRKMLRMEKIAHPRRDLVERNGKYYLEEKNEENG